MAYQGSILLYSSQRKFALRMIKKLHIREKCSVAIQVHEALPANTCCAYTIMLNRQVQTWVQYMHKGPCFTSSLCPYVSLADWLTGMKALFIPIQVSVPAFNWILFGPTWWEQCVFWMQVMGRLSDIFPSQGPSLSIFFIFFIWADVWPNRAEIP